jgi:serine/threonine protein kinase
MNFFLTSLLSSAVMYYSRARFYAAELCLALEHLHKNQVYYSACVNERKVVLHEK